MNKTETDREFIIFLMNEIGDYITHSKLKPISELAEGLVIEFKKRYKI